MDLSTTYLGFELAHPLIPGAGPLTIDLDMARRLEDAGAPMIVMPSLFEEQIVSEQLTTHYSMVTHADSFAEALSYFPDPRGFAVGPNEYLEKVRKLREALKIPVVASLNGMTEGRWLDYARQIQAAGASALELNVYFLATSLEESAETLEARTVEIVTEIKRWLTIPLAVKLSPFYTALPHFAWRLANAGADGLILFNRFYQPDIDPEALEVSRKLELSNSSELLLRLHALAILSGRLGGASLAITGGVHTGLDAVKSVMSGAHGIQMVSCLLQRGPKHLTALRNELAQWLVDHEYESLRQAQGSMSLLRCSDPHAYERANYMQMLQSWKG